MNVTEAYYQKLIQMMLRAKRHMFAVLEKNEMTPMQGMFLMLFEGNEAKSMQELSALLGCDASNVTGLVDRLEAQGLLERTVDPKDRRVKMIKLSKKGHDCRKMILKGLAEMQQSDLNKLTDKECQCFINCSKKILN